MNVLSVFAAVGRLFGSACNPFARSVWCREQRRRLRVPGHSVVWIRGDVLSWAEWGARRGYFEVQQMDGLSYLRAAGAPIV
jgi:hypothetical protein